MFLVKHCCDVIDTQENNKGDECVTPWENKKDECRWRLLRFCPHSSFVLCSFCFVWRCNSSLFSTHKRKKRLL